MRRVWWVVALVLWLSASAGVVRSAPPVTAPGRIAFVRGGSLWLWENETERKIVQGEDVSAPRFSADGRYIAYRQRRAQYVIRADGTGPWAVPGRSYEWSPAGNLLALETPPGLRVVPISSQGPGAPQMLIPGWSDPAWSPDGQRLAVVKVVPGAEHMTGTSLIGVTALTDKEPRVIWQESFHYDESKGAYGRAGDLRWSADGRWLSFLRYGPTGSSMADRNQLVVLPSTGGRAVLLAEMPYNRAFYAWSPFGAKLAFTDGAGRFIWENKQVRVAEMPPRPPFPSLTPRGYADREPAWHPSGQYLALSRSIARAPQPMQVPAAEQAIWVMPAATGDGWQVPGSDGGIGPRWGRDGSLLWAVPPGDHTAATLWWKPAGDKGQARAVIRGIDLKYEYYGQWPWREVFDWWTPPRPG